MPDEWFLNAVVCRQCALRSPCPAPTAGIAEKARALGDRYNRPGYATAQIKYTLNLTLGQLFLDKTATDVILKIGAIAGTHALWAISYMTKDDKISKDEIHKTILTSGYILEQRIEPILTGRKYYVERNEVYRDDETNKSRETDIIAVKVIHLDKDYEGMLTINLLIECENNKQPVVFFRSNNPLKSTFVYDLQITGIPLRVFIKNKYKTIIQDILDLEKYHHYGKGPHSTQYCTFIKNNKSDTGWIATHTDEQHNSFVSLIKCLKYMVDSHYESYELPKKGKKEQIDIHMYYPILVLGGDLYEGVVNDKREFELTEKDHISFRKFDATLNREGSYQFDVVRESHLLDYLTLIDKEINKIKKRLVENTDTLKYSTEKTLKELRKTSKKNFRKILGG